MDICEHCGSLFLRGRGDLLLIELEDLYGIWHEWLCGPCVDELAQLVHERHSTLVRFSVFGWELADFRVRRAS